MKNLSVCVFVLVIYLLCGNDLVTAAFLDRYDMGAIKKSTKDKQHQIYVPKYVLTFTRNQNQMFSGSGCSSSLKLVIDNDAGADDAMAIFMVILSEKHLHGPQLVALTTGNGNTNEDNVYRNNQRILKVAKRQDVPIYRGSKKSLVTTPEITDYFGVDGLGDVESDDTGLVPAKEKNAVLALIELSQKYEGELVVVTIGALTNIAMAIKLDSNFLSRLAHMYVGASHIHSETEFEAEFNAHMDEEAYHILVQHATPDKVTVFPFSQAKQYLNFTREWREQELGILNNDYIKALNLYERVSIQSSPFWQQLDPATVAIFIQPSLVSEYKYSKNDNILCGDKRGMNTNEFVKKEDTNVRIVYSVKNEEYKQFLLDIFAKK